MRINLLQGTEPFFPLFQQQSEALRDASRLLVEEAHSGDQRAPSVAAEILDLEHRGDALLRDILHRVNANLISPLEPEDIRRLASRLDDVLDGIEEAAYRIAAYHLPELPAAAVRLCEIIETCARLIDEAIGDARNRRGIQEQCTQINRLENEADRMTRSGIGELLEDGADPVAILKLKEIYELLEKTVDRCEDVADILANIAVHYR